MIIWFFDSLAPGQNDRVFVDYILEYILLNGFLYTLTWILQTLVNVMSCVKQATRRYLSQWWSS